MDFSINFYKDSSGKSPVEEFLMNLAESNIRLVFKTKQAFEKLRNRVYHKEPLSKYVEPGLWELRVRSGTDILRRLYTFEKGRIIILLHGFVKKQQKTPLAELETARKILQELKRRIVI